MKKNNINRNVGFRFVIVLWYISCEMHGESGMVWFGMRERKRERGREVIGVSILGCDEPVAL